jgi:hypothetical protein
MPPAAWLWSSFARRSGELKLRKRRDLQASLKIREIDHLSWQEFEIQCVIVLQLMGYRNVAKTRNIPGVKAVDITATDPDSSQQVIFECKHRTLKPVGVSEVDQLIGRFADGIYAGLPVTLMTNARVTQGARDKGARHGIKIIGRERLAELATPASGQFGDRPGRGGGGSRRRQGAPCCLVQRTAAADKFATAVTAVSSLAVFVIVTQMAVTGPRPAVAAPTAPGPRSAANGNRPVHHPPVKAATTPNGETPQAIARAYFSAISEHHWPQVWQLGGKNVGRGPYATYQGMIAGYRDTIRDVPLTMTAAGDTVSGRFLAYETGNRVQTYAFSYLTRDGAIVGASQQVVATTG